jgi:hypothetical protein
MPASTLSSTAVRTVTASQGRILLAAPVGAAVRVAVAVVVVVLVAVAGAVWLNSKWRRAIHISANMYQLT